MNNNSNYPPWVSESTFDAPWNQEDKEVSYIITLNIIDFITSNIKDLTDEFKIKELTEIRKKEIIELIKEFLSKEDIIVKYE